MEEPRIAVVGGGNMARAIVEGCIRSGAFGPDRWLVSEPDDAKRRGFERLGVATVPSTADLAPLLAPADQLLLAVKPQALSGVAGELAHADLDDRIVISILAGTPAAKARAALGDRGRIIRVMPNTPALVGRGATAIAPGPSAEPGDEAVAEEIFRAVGEVWRIEESLMDAFTAVAGSGPAYVFALAEAMSTGAAGLGFAPEQAEAIIRATVSGAAALLDSSDREAGELRAAVTFKGGTTEAALGVLRAAGMMESIVEAIAAAERRGRAMAEGG